MKGRLMFIKRTPILSFLTILIVVGFAWAITITPTSNPTGSTSNASVIISYNFSTDYNNQTLFNWDGTNYSLYDGSLVLFYNFDNRSALGENDTRVIDLSRYGNNGTVIGGSNISWTPNGYYGGAYNFSGNVNYIQSNYNISNTSLPFTINTWVSDYEQGARKSIADYRSSNNIFTFYTVNGKLGFDLWNMSGTASSVISQLTMNKGTNYMVTAQYNGSNLLIYINGTLMGQSVMNGTANNSALNKLRIGTEINNLARFWNGTIDNFAIFNRSLSNLEINELYMTQITKYDSQNWTYIVNQELNQTLNSINSNRNFIYQLCVSNITMNVCTSQNNITQIIPNKNINAQFSTSIGTINSNYYGFLAQRDSFSNSTDFVVDDDYNGIPNQVINSSFNRNGYLNTKSNLMIIPYSTTSYFENSSVSTPNMTYINQSIRFKQTFDFAYANNNRIVIVWLNRVPLWLANRTTMCQENNFTCTPNNYTKFSEQFLYFFNNITENGLKINNVYVSFANEPEDPSSFLSNVSRTNITRSLEINNFYNNSYNYFKSYYPNVPFGGLNSHINQIGSNIIFPNFLGNMSSKIDFISFHTLRDDSNEDYSTLSQSVYSQIYSNCSNYGVNCNTLIETEYKYKNSTVQNDSSLWNIWSSNLASALQGGLISYPSNLSKAYYVWTDFSLEQNLTDKPFILTAVNQIYPKIYPPYNVTKNFANYCPAGGTVYASSSDDSTVKTVTCAYGNQRNIIIINTDTSSKNVTVNLTGVGLAYIRDAMTGSLYNARGTVGLGIKDSYDITYLTGELFIEPTTQASNDLCSNTVSGFAGLGAKMAILLTILGMVLVISVIGLFIFIVNGSDNFPDTTFAIPIIAGVVIFFVFIIAIVFGVSFVCNVFAP